MLFRSLFRSESRTKRRTNLMVFLRPVVMRDADSTAKFSLDRYDEIRGRQDAAQPSPSVVIPINESPVLPPLKGAQPQPQQPAKDPLVKPVPPGGFGTDPAPN